MRLMVLACAATFGLAQADIPDPPSRVARISYLDGPVSLKPGGVDDWVPALFNRPMTTGEGIWSDAGSRVELSLGTSAIRLSQQTAMSFLALDDNTTQIRLDQGAVEITVKKLDGSERYEVDTPNTAYLLKAPGEYRFDVNEDGQLTALVVRTGVVEAAGGGQKFNVNAPEMARVSGSDSIHYQSGPAPQADDFEEWATSRDQRTEIADQVPQEVIGHEDLDPQGWSADSQYGLAWQPTDVAADWTPYSDGRWVSVQPWGWTWVDSRPWGFATYHYGRWVLIRGHWAWVPGLMGPRPVYAPALVAFVGIGVGIGLATGSVGWVPLGPGEAYRPWYHASDRYVQGVNPGRPHDVGAITGYANRGATTLVPAGVMAGSRPVREAAQTVSPQTLAAARPVSGREPIRPTALTAGVSPAAAHQMNLAPAVGGAAAHAAPGPAIRPEAPGVRPALRTSGQAPAPGPAFVPHGTGPGQAAVPAPGRPGAPTPATPGARPAGGPGPAAVEPAPAGAPQVHVPAQRPPGPVQLPAAVHAPSAPAPRPAEPPHAAPPPAPHAAPAPAPHPAAEHEKKPGER